MLKRIFTTDRPLLLVGCGNMGAALAEGWLATDLPRDHLHILEPQASARARQLACALHAEPPADLRPRAIVLAIKPQVMGVVLPGLQPLVGPDTLVLSIAAGLSTGQLEQQLGGKGQIVRAMPNTPAAIGAGISALFAPASVPEGARTLAGNLLAAAGKMVWLDSEDQMAAVTALSGSGPGYIFYLLECLIRSGTALGLGQDLAHALAVETLLGSARLAAQTGADPADLRRQVTSPNGTTAAGLEVLMRADGLDHLVQQTLDAAAQRARELGG